MEIRQEENECENDLEHLTSTVAGNIREGVRNTGSFFSTACIYRVPESLRKLKESAYTPRLIAIGPLHRNDEHLQTPLQHVKMSYTNYLLSRVEPADQVNFNLLIKACLAEMKTLIDRAKKCYAAEVTLDEEMMLVDGCFILEYLYRCSGGSPENGQNTTDPIRGNQLTAAYVTSDLLLLENQIPFFVLEKLFELTVARIPNRPNPYWSLTGYVMYHYHKNSSNNSGIPPRDCYHILQKVHDAYMLRSEEPGQNSKIVLMPSASELVYAGVKFVPGAADNQFKLKFTEPESLFWWCHSAHFEIPQLEIYDQTESFLRNHVALEQCCRGVSQHVSSYVGLMDMLVNTDKDVQVLEKAGVMINYLGASQDATDLFNKLTKEIIIRDPLGEICEKATRYSKRFWPRNMAHLRRTYLSSPWTFIAFCAGFIVFFITVVQFGMAWFQFVRDFLRKKG